MAVIPSVLEAAKTEIRAIFSNELECTNENTVVIDGTVIFERTIKLQGMNNAVGKTCIAHFVYLICKDGYWEQVACYYEDWK